MSNGQAETPETPKTSQKEAPAIKKPVGVSLPRELPRADPLPGGDRKGDLTVLSEDEHFMRMAIAVAASEGNDPALSPIGCVIVRQGKVLSATKNGVEPLHDATAHAEMLAIRESGAPFPMGNLGGATLYSTLQPCGMCTMASIWAKVGRIVYGAGRSDVHRMYFEDRHIDTLNIITDAWRQDLSLTGGVLREECARLYFRPWDNVPVEQQGNL
ncbi:nucleoside deaminase [Novosphingobium rosa]|uniref:nucleoside deaminase n=1 Tax=Novosphingobium rosa TaxID=76978 RepID=UPI0009FC8E72|nr:nucleoside deaminase [Novosphingobium rosa]